jgi:hypothetical protein
VRIACAARATSQRLVLPLLLLQIDRISAARVGSAVVVFTAKSWRGEIETREPEKCAGWQWLPLAKLPANTVPYARQAIADLTSGKRVGLFGWS